MAGVFISYRREDSAAWTGRIYDRTCTQLGSEHVFLDVEAIAPGEDFAVAITETLAKVDVVMVVIGPGWLEARSTDGERRLNDPADYVRREIALALESGARVIPILISGAQMPAEPDLPSDIGALARRNAVSVSDTRFDQDVGRLLEEVARIAAPSVQKQPPPHNLPAQHTAFIGRTDEIRAARKLLKEESLVSLLGPGGSGKTRLAVQLAADAVYQFEDGVWFVDLREIDASADVATHVASTMRVVTMGDAPLLDELAAALASRRLLLILDNCEHVVDGVATLAQRLIGRDGRIRILATTREPLGVPGEAVMFLPPMSLPEASDHDRLLDSEAVRLFTDRAHRARETFVLDDHIDAVVGICGAVEGLPLALELAAARLRAMSPEEVARRLEDQVDLLRTSRRAGDIRHAAMESTIAWSWDMLDDNEKSLFGRLSIFRGTWSLEAAEAICGFEPLEPRRILDLLEALLDKSMISLDESAGGTRYRMLEPIRQFAAGTLDDGGMHDLRERCVDFWSASLGPTWTRPDDIADFFEPAWALAPDRANLSAAVEWALDMGRYEDAMRIFASPFGQLLRLEASPVDRARKWVDEILEHRELIPPGLLHTGLELASGLFAQFILNEDFFRYAELARDVAPSVNRRLAGELAVAIALSRSGRSEEAAMIFDRVLAESGDPALRASTLVFKSQGLGSAEKWELAQQILELAPLDSLGNADESFASWIIGMAASWKGRYDLAIEMAERSLETSRRWGYAVMAGYAASQVAGLCQLMGRPRRAAAVMDEAVPVARRILGPAGVLVYVLREAAGIARYQGDLVAAHAYLEEAERACEQSPDPDDPVDVLVEFALLERDSGDPTKARQLLDAAAQRVEEEGLGDYMMRRMQATQASVELRLGDYASFLHRVRGILSEADWLPHFRILEVLDMEGIGLVQTGDVASGARLLSAVDGERERTGLVVPPPDVAIREAAIAQGRAALGDAWEAEVERGRSMSLDEAVEYAKEFVASV